MNSPDGAAVPDMNTNDHQPTEIVAQLHLVLDNMPGALVYTDRDLKVVICNTRFKEMYKVPQELLQPGRPYADFLRYLAENGYYGESDVEAHVARRVESTWTLSSPGVWRACAILPGRASRITPRTAGGIAYSAAGWRAAARSRS